jgi:hypothetical protein
MRRQTAVGDQVIFDLLRDEPNGPAQLEKGQAVFAQVKDGLEADVKVLGDLFARP